MYTLLLEFSPELSLGPLAIFSCTNSYSSNACWALFSHLPLSYCEVEFNGECSHPASSALRSNNKLTQIVNTQRNLELLVLCWLTGSFCPQLSFRDRHSVLVSVCSCSSEPITVNCFWGVKSMQRKVRNRIQQSIKKKIIRYLIAHTLLS